MQPTKLKYMDDMFLYEDIAKVVGREKDGEGRDVIILDQTIFYPQGGGQPYDTGKIIKEGAEFVVEEVRFDKGIVKHIGEFSSGSFEVGDEVTLEVIKEQRELNARIHTAGHVIDVAIESLGYDFTPSKGFHFPAGPYVEYKGEIPEDKRDEFVTKVQQKVDEMISEEFVVKTQYAKKEELSSLCNFVPEWLPNDKPIRVVTVYGNNGHPCGGVHVKNIKDIGNLNIKGVKSKKGDVRVRYEIE